MYKSPYPNPFSNYVALSFDLKNSMDFKINIFDLLGRKVNTIERKNARSGRLIMYWDGKNIDGERLGSGVYFAKPTSVNKIDPIKVVLLRK